MKYFITSDRHLGHHNVINFSARPEDFADKLWNWLKNVPDDAVLICLGDMSRRWLKLLEPLKQFKFKKILVKWNHDKDTYTKLSEYFDFVCESFSLYRYDKYILFTHQPQFPLPENTLNIHWHFHNINLPRCMEVDYPNETYTDNHIRISCERLNYRPIEMEHMLFGDYIQKIQAQQNRLDSLYYKYMK